MAAARDGGFTSTTSDTSNPSGFYIIGPNNNKMPLEYLNSYHAPFNGQHSSFETIMNNPSNPLVNPTNSNNPLEHSQTLFGPWTNL